jgi:hypothetical protein
LVVSRQERRGRVSVVRRIEQKHALAVHARNRIAEILKPLNPKERLLVLREFKRRLKKQKSPT